jgi:tetratricopeptide (TPR) repeat protein
MKKLLGFILVLVSFLNASAQNKVCDQLKKTDAKLTLLRKQIQQDKTDKTMKSIISLSRDAAEFYISCIKDRIGMGQNDKLSAHYQIGKYYYDAGDCTNSLAYFKKCLDLPICATTKFASSQHSFKDMIHKISSGGNCSKKVRENPSGLKIVSSSKVTFSSGKGQYQSWVDKEAQELNRTNTLDSLPLLSTEIEELEGRVFPLSDSASAVAMIKGVAGKDAEITFSSPFIIVNLNGNTGNFSYDVNNQTLKEQKGTDGLGNVGPRRGSELSIINKMKADSLFKDLKIDHFIPLYLYNGKYNQDSYNDFLNFCSKIHFRYPGQRIGYYNEYDNSAVAWMPSGYGTFAHELKHVFLHNDFPGIPVWLDEGIASLNEEVDRDGKRLDNWRLVYIRSFQKISKSYFSIDRIVNYENIGNQQLNLVHDSFCRYFCMFLEEKGLLGPYYAYLKQNIDNPISFDEQAKKLFSKDIKEMDVDFNVWLDARTIPYRWDSKPYVEQVGLGMSTIKLPD